MQKKIALLGITKKEASLLMEQLGESKFRANQLCEWLYKKQISSIEEMSNLSKALRQKLNEQYQIGATSPLDFAESKDGTKKYLYSAGDQKYIETAYIPEKERATLCVSTQIGCKMGCIFCNTAQQGFTAQLTAGEIINQFRSLPEQDNISNIVFMGMGEPFDNTNNVLKSLEILTSDWGYAMSPTRFTISTVGLLPGTERFLKESRCHLAISLHSPFEEERNQLMPVTKLHPLTKLITLLKKHNWQGQRRLTFEYILLEGRNDSAQHAKKLVQLLRGLRCRVNLLNFHTVPDSELHGTSREKLEWFQNQLKQNGITTTIRRSRGEDIQAACGLLSTKKMMEQKQ